MSSELVAIFTTSEIQRVSYSGPVDFEATSTGALERALEQGFTVFVVTTRPRLGLHDIWWIDLVGEDSVFVAEDSYAVESDSERDAAVNAGWRRLFERLDQPWPTHTWTHPRTGETVTTQEHWVQAQAALVDRGYARGRDFATP